MVANSFERSEEDKRLDALANKVSHALDKALNADVARVCAGIAAAAVAMDNETTEERVRNLEQLFTFMRQTMLSIEETEQKWGRLN